MLHSRGIWWAQVDSNHRPLPCQGSVLPLNYAPKIPRLYHTSLDIRKYELLTTLAAAPELPTIRPFDPRYRADGVILIRWTDGAVPPVRREHDDGGVVVRAVDLVRGWKFAEQLRQFLLEVHSTQFEHCRVVPSLLFLQFVSVGGAESERSPSGPHPRNPLRTIRATPVTPNVPPVEQFLPCLFASNQNPNSHSRKPCFLFSPLSM